MDGNSNENNIVEEIIIVPSERENRIIELMDKIAYVELTDPLNENLLTFCKMPLINYAKEKLGETIEENYVQSFPTQMMVEYLQAECMTDETFVKRVLLQEKSINKCMKWFYKILVDYYAKTKQCWMPDQEGKNECKKYFMTDEAEQYEKKQLEEERKREVHVAKIKANNKTAKNKTTAASTSTNSKLSTPRMEKDSNELSNNENYNTPEMSKEGTNNTKNDVSNYKENVIEKVINFTTKNQKKHEIEGQISLF